VTVSDDESVTIADAPERSRYEIHVDGTRAGFAAYTRTPGEIVYEHTEIDDAFAHRGLAGRLIQFALDDSRARGEHVVARCPFVRDFLRKHPDYAELTRRRA
jgi:predicted GNAT family acetyltransferase